MLKLLGAVCVLAGGGTVWLRQVSASRRELAALREVLLVLDQMEGEVHLLRTPLPRLLRKLARGRTGSVSAWLTALAAGLERGEPLQSCAAGATGFLPVESEGRGILLELAEKLSGSEEQVCNGISLVRGELTDLLDRKRLQQREAEKRIAALCFSAAALLIILLL